MNRRGVLAGVVAAVAAVPIVRLFAGTNDDESEQVQAQSSGVEKIVKTEAEWREILTPEEFDVLRNEATERPGASALNKEKRPGTFTCAGCELPLFKTEWKYESGTGWPSFWDHVKGHMETKKDYKLYSRALSITAHDAAATKAMCLRMAPRLPASVGVITGWR